MTDVERIKELEARAEELELFVKRIAHRWVPKRMTLGLLRENCRAESIHAAALLKDTDQ